MKTQDQTAAQIYRNCIQHHRNQMRYLFYLMRETGLNRHTGMKLVLSHRDEIRETFRQWELSHPIKRTAV